MPTRYEGKPFLRLRECYVLWAIGQLTAEQSASLDRLAPKLRETFKQDDGAWHDVVHSETELPASMPDQIRRIWSENMARFADRGSRPTRRRSRDSLSIETSSTPRYPEAALVGQRATLGHVRR
jgi:hypothetical protein